MTCNELIDLILAKQLEGYSLDELPVVCAGPRERTPDPQVKTQPDWDDFGGQEALVL